MGYSQYGEDEVLSKRFSGRPPGFFVEVGAGDGQYLSNTLLLEERGWRGLLIEANPTAAEMCRQRRTATVVEQAVSAPGGPPTLPFQLVDGIPDLSSLSLTDGHRRLIADLEGLVPGGVDIRTIEVMASTLDTILAREGVVHIDIMTIDVEGHEREVLRGFELRRWAPEALILERTSRRPDLQILRYMHRSGYAFEQRTGVNDWYRRGSLINSWWRIATFTAVDITRHIAHNALKRIRQPRQEGRA